MKLTVMLAALVVHAACAQTPAQANDAWKKMEFLLGAWTGIAGENDTQIGAGQGVASFELDLDKKIIVRHNRASYASGVKHDDLLIIYLDIPDSTPRAIYFDSEGHVIRYNVATPAPGKAVFESDGSQPAPRYRLTYWMERSSLRGTFEVAPPGADYQTYMSWISKR